MSALAQWQALGPVEQGEEREAVRRLVGALRALDEALALAALRGRTELAGKVTGEIQFLVHDIRGELERWGRIIQRGEGV